MQNFSKKESILRSLFIIKNESLILLNENLPII
jgi:hypothetical protein